MREEPNADWNGPDGEPLEGGRLPGVGTRVGDYLLLAPLGAGGMGAVYRASDPAGRHVAVKLLSLAPDSKTSERFKREAEITASLDHPGIVRVHATGSSQGRRYVVYELVEGQTLRARLPTLERQAALQILVEVAQAVGHAHQRGVIHRDLKSENILLDTEDRPRVADFGLARAETDERLTRTGGLVGTPYAMAPEQISGKRDQQGPPTDVWALGVLLYQVLTGTEPFGGGGLTELMAQIVARNCARPRALDPTISPALEEVCLTALEPEPSRRYADAGAFADALSAARAAVPSRGPFRWVVAALGGLGFVGVLVGIGLGGEGGPVSARAPGPSSTPDVDPLPRAPRAPAIDPRESGRRDAHRKAAGDALDALRVGRLDRVTRALQAFARAGAPASPADQRQLCERVLQEALRLLDVDSEAAVTLVEALAQTGLRAQERRTGGALVATAYAKLGFGSLSRRAYGRLMLAAGQLDLPLSHRFVQPIRDHQDALPPATSASEAWIDLIVLRARLVPPVRGDAQRLSESLVALLLAEPPALNLGPCGWADCASLLSLEPTDRVYALLDKAQGMDPQNPFVRWRRSILLAADERTSEAVDEIQRALELFDSRCPPGLDHMTLGVFHDQLLRCQLALGRRDEARVTWRRLKAYDTRRGRYLKAHPWLKD